MRLIDADALKRNFMYLPDGTPMRDNDCDNFPNTIDLFTIKKMIREASTAMQWVSVEDELPQDGQRVIMFLSNTGNDPPMIIGNWLGIKTSFYYGLTYNKSSVVTHWMPLPEPPVMH